VAARDVDVPRYTYPLAVVAGVCCTGAAFAFATLVTHVFDRWERGLGFIGAVVVASAHVLIGGLFGMLWPEKKWRWGVWLCLVPVCLVSASDPDVTAFFWVVVLTLAPACAGAYVAARVHLKYVEAE
jgi:MFS family permease